MAASKRRFGEGSVTKYTYKGKTRTFTKWRYQIQIPLDPDHPNGEKKLTGKGGFTTQKEALTALKEAQKKLEAGIKHDSGKTTLSTYAWEWIDSLRLAPTTLAGYKKIIRNHIDPELGAIPLEALTATRINKHYKELLEHGRKDGVNAGKPLSSNTVNKIHTVLAAVLESAVNDNYILSNPAKKSAVKAPKTKEITAAKEEIKPWSVEELKAFLHWDSEVYNDELYTLWLIYAMTGVRRSEGLALKWSDFDPANMTLAVRRAVDPATPGAVKTTKSGKARVLDLAADEVAALKSWKAKRAQLGFELVKADAYIFGNLQGGVRSPNEIGRRWKYRVARAQKELPELRTITLHDLRHTHATLLLQAGVQPKIVQERLGHSTIAITMNTYSHVMPTMQRAAVDSLSALMA